MDDIFSLIPTATIAPKVGEYAIADEKRGINIGTEARLALANSEATALHPLALTSAQAKKVTQNRMRQAMAELTNGKIDRIGTWLEEVAAKDPARAIEIFMELASFSLPKLKSVEVSVAAPGQDVKQYTVQQLEQLLSGDESIVDTQ